MNAPSLVLLALVAALALGLWWIVDRARTLFVIRVEGVRFTVVRGECPPGLLDAISEVLAHAEITEATVRAVRTGEGQQLRLKPPNASVEQRLRNLLATRR